MRNAMLAGAGVLAIAGAAAASPVLVTFDDVTGAGIATVPNGYMGFNWGSTGAIDGGTFYTNSGYENGVVSGAYVGFNEFASLASVTNGTFDFTSGYFTGAWNDGLNVRIVGKLAGNTIYDNTIQVNTSGPSLFLANFLGIDTLEISSFGGTQNPNLDAGGTHVAFDDLLFNSTVIPLPSAAAMGLAGLGIVGLRRRSR